MISQVNKLSPRGGEMICPLPMAVRVMADLHSPHISGGRLAAGSQHAYSLGWDKQTDRGID